MRYRGALAVVLFLAAPAFGQAPGFLGIRAQKGETFDQCAIIAQLAPGGPGERAGLAPGDVIVSINGVAVDCAGIQKGKPLVPELKAGDQVAFSVQRAGKTLDIAVTAEALPAEIFQAQEERARMEAGREIFQRLVRTREIFTVTLKKGGGFELSGKMTDQELEQLHYYFEKGREGATFSQVMKKDRQDMYVHFDREKGAVQFEFVDSTSATAPAQP